MTQAIPGYAYGNESLAKSPVTPSDFELLKKSVLFGDGDVAHLRMSGEVLKDQAEAVLDVWYGFVASNPHLVQFFGRKPDGAPDAEYLAAVRKRFVRWILDTAAAEYDQKWLDYQHEIGLRHHRAKKNKTDGVKSADLVNYRYMVAFIYPITATLKPFLAKKGHSADEVEKMHQAWQKSVIMQVILWTQPYVTQGDF